ncbi:hypothetical protein PAECIP111894_05988 [Paenibacillus pseudetheri]|uniref:Uncharacterized protein n=2 Tax=Paenibacillus pseudetheri TaxID=2897682 RepID=A0ABM9BMT5_9BACL|nr:hypothetical protein PAECIP111894_05988 [Paenibacillus pseudetheri]
MNINLLLDIYDRCNEHLFRLDPLPWSDEKSITKNINTYTKRRISVSGLRKMIKMDESYDSADYDELIKSHIIVEVNNSDSYVVITEYGLLYLNIMLKEQTLDHYTALKIAKDNLMKSSAEVIKRKCETVFSIDISPQEAILSLFLLLNGADSYSNSFQLLTNQNGEYLHGKIIINEINNIFMELCEDEQEIIIKDEKEFRNVIGRNGKNGRLAKAFPGIFFREDRRIWFEINKNEPNGANLVILKGIISELTKLLSKDIAKERVMVNLTNIIENYMINNPIEPYIQKDIFSGTNKFNQLVDLHIVVKDLNDFEAR